MVPDFTAELPPVIAPTSRAAEAVARQYEHFRAMLAQRSWGGMLFFESDEDRQAREYLRALIKRGWKALYTEMWGEDFVAATARHHRTTIKWHWTARHRFIRHQKPKYFADFPIWSRGHMKSTVARKIAVVDAVLSWAYGEPAYILYVSRNSEMVEKHAQSIQTLISSPDVKRLCPPLSRVKLNEQGKSKGWKAKFLNTAANVVFHFGSLDEGLAGGNIDDVRPTFIMPDDIDGRESEPTMGVIRFNKLTSEVLPMRQWNTLTIWAQNLINRYSAMYKVWSGQERVLTNRRPSNPVKAVIDLVTKVETVNGIPKDVYVSGKPTWHIWTKERIQEEIDTYGLKAFKRECQHEVDQSKDGLLIQNYDDAVHVISESEFAAMFGQRTMPLFWYKELAHDWARTKSEFHANVALFLATAPMNSPLPGFQFIFNPMSFPTATEPEKVAERILNFITPTVRDNENNTYTWRELIEFSLNRSGINKFVTDTTEFLKKSREAIANFVPDFARPLFERYLFTKCRMSHEAKPQRTVYNDSFGIPFEPCNPGADGGVDQIDAAFKIDYDLPHPFRPGQKGYTRTFVVVPDDKLQLNNAQTPEEMHDHDLLRFQLKNWRTKPPKVTESGEKIDEMLKMHDDFGNALMMLFHDADFITKPLTTPETFEAKIAIEKPHLTDEAIETVRAAGNEETATNLAQKKKKDLANYLDDIADRRARAQSKTAKFRNREDAI
jgi:hypothetical protein